MTSSGEVNTSLTMIPRSKEPGRDMELLSQSRCSHFFCNSLRMYDCRTSSTSHRLPQIILLGDYYGSSLADCQLRLSHFEHSIPVYPNILHSLVYSHSGMVVHS